MTNADEEKKTIKITMPQIAHHGTATAINERTCDDSMAKKKRNDNKNNNKVKKRN